MSLFHMITAPWRRKTRFEDLALQIAHSHWVKVWDRLSDQVWQMSRHERRGYIRARGALLIQEAVEKTLRQLQLPHVSMVKLYAHTMDQVVSLVVDHMADCLPNARSHRRVA
jgi:hypothetical protein